MADPDPAGAARRRVQLIALGLAGAALAVAAVAAVVVINRTPAASAAAIETHRVAAADLLALARSGPELVVDHGVTRGARLTSVPLLRTFALQSGDVIVAISGRVIAKGDDLREVVFNASLLNATTLYVELERDREPMLVRWEIDGSIREARYADRSSTPWSDPP